jgi:hypothetical protein
MIADDFIGQTFTSTIELSLGRSIHLSYRLSSVFSRNGAAAQRKIAALRLCVR